MTKIPYLKEILKWSFDFQGKNTHTHPSKLPYYMSASGSVQ